MILRFIIFSILFSNIILFSESKAWDTTAAKFYPINKDNTYIYKKEFYNIFCVLLTDKQYLRVKITGDTVMSNGKKYFEFDGYNYFSNWNYQRIDSNSMNVYGYNNGYEILIDSLLGRKNDYFSGKRNLNSVFAKVDEEINNFPLFGNLRNAKIILNNSSELFFSYYLIEYFGLGYMVVCTKDSGYILSTLGCVINGVVYGDTALTRIQEVNSIIPENFFLSQNYPNPFNPTTRLDFGISNLGFVSLKVYDVLGNEISTLVNENKPTGSYSVEFDGRNFSSGIYFYKLETENFSETKRMALIK
ncbi:MAG: T9SS type A sorting domain-containing protein [bacterium]